MFSARLARARHPGGPPMNGRIVVRIPRWVKRRLRRQMQQTRDAAFRTRVQIVLLYEAGLGAQRIAASLGCVPATAVACGPAVSRTGRRCVARMAAAATAS